LKDHADCLWWGERLAEGLQNILDMEGIHRVEYFEVDD